MAVGVVEMQEKHDVTPGLAVVLVGDDPASAVYVNNKRRACEQPGFSVMRRISLQNPRKMRSSPVSRASTKIPEFMESWCNYHCPKELTNTT